MIRNIAWLAPEILYADSEFQIWRTAMSVLRNDPPIVRQVIRDGAFEARLEYERALQVLADWIETHGASVEPLSAHGPN